MDRMQSDSGPTGLPCSVARRNVKNAEIRCVKLDVELPVFTLFSDTGISITGFSNIKGCAKLHLAVEKIFSGSKRKADEVVQEETALSEADARAKIRIDIRGHVGEEVFFSDFYNDYARMVDEKQTEEERLEREEEQKRKKKAAQDAIVKAEKEKEEQKKREEKEREAFEKQAYKKVKKQKELEAAQTILKAGELAGSITEKSKQDAEFGAYYQAILASLNNPIYANALTTPSLSQVLPTVVKVTLKLIS